MFKSTNKAGLDVCPSILTYCSESAVTCQLTLKVADEINFENGTIYNFQRHVPLTFYIRPSVRPQKVSPIRMTFGV